MIRQGRARLLRAGLILLAMTTPAVAPAATTYFGTQLTLDFYSWDDHDEDTLFEVAGTQVSLGILGGGRGLSLGAETHASLSGVSDSEQTGLGRRKLRVRESYGGSALIGLGSVRTRRGISMLYARGGWEWTRFSGKAPASSQSFSQTLEGPRIGLGMMGGGRSGRGSSGLRLEIGHTFYQDELNAVDVNNGKTMFTVGYVFPL